MLFSTLAFCKHHHFCWNSLPLIQPSGPDSNFLHVKSAPVLVPCPFTRASKCPWASTLPEGASMTRLTLSYCSSLRFSLVFLSPKKVLLKPSFFLHLVSFSRFLLKTSWIPRTHLGSILPRGKMNNGNSDFCFPVERI